MNEKGEWKLNENTLSLLRGKRDNFQLYSLAGPTETMEQKHWKTAESGPILQLFEENKLHEKPTQILK